MRMHRARKMNHSESRVDSRFGKLACRYSASEEVRERGEKGKDLKQKHNNKKTPWGVLPAYMQMLS